MHIFPLKNTQFRAITLFFFLVLLNLGAMGDAIVRNIIGVYFQKHLLTLYNDNYTSYWNSYLSEYNGNKYLPESIENLLTWGEEDSLKQNDTRWNFLVGVIRMSQGELDASKKALQRLLINSSDTTGLPQFYLGLVHRLGGYNVDSIQIWRQYPDISRFFLQIGLDGLDKKNYPIAQEYFVIATEIDSTKCESKYYSAMVWHQLGNFQYALDTLSGSEKMECSSQTLGYIYFLRGKLFSRIGENELSIIEVQRSLNFDRDTNRLLLLAGLLAKKDTYLAYSLLMEALEKSPDNVWPYIELCKFHMKKKQVDEALVWCTQANEKFPKSPYPYHYTGMIYLRLKQYSTAVRWFEQALQLDPKNINTWFQLGNSYKAIGDIDNVKRVCQMVLLIDPEIIEARMCTEYLNHP